VIDIVIFGEDFQPRREEVKFIIEIKNFTEKEAENLIYIEFVKEKVYCWTNFLDANNYFFYIIFHLF